MPSRASLFFSVLFFWAANVPGVLPPLSQANSQDVLGNPEPLDWQGDIASRLVSAADEFLLRQISEVDTQRAGRWQAEWRKFDDPTKFGDEKRKRLARILGVRDPRVPFQSPELVTTISRGSRLALNKNLEVHAVRIPVLDGMHLEGLWIHPRAGEIRNNLVVVPDADQTPEALVGLDDSLPAREQIARRLAELGNQVIVPTVICREMEKRRGRANLTHREFLYRPAFELGRHLIGYEIQKVLAVVDWYQQTEPERPIGVWGTGEGGLLAMHAAALDPRIDQVAIDDYLGGRETCWRQPISRNVFGLLQEFGDAEVLSLIAPRPILQISHPDGVTLQLPSEGGAPAELRPATAEQVSRVVRDFRDHAEQLSFQPTLLTVTDRDRQLGAAIRFFDQVKPADPTAWKLSHLDGSDADTESGSPWLRDWNVDAEQRMNRQIKEIDRFNQHLLARSEEIRREFMSELDTGSLDRFEATVEPYREYFATQVIGRFDLPLREFRPRVRLLFEQPSYTGYEVVLDVFDNVFAYGIILVPKGLRDGEQRPVVVCQHGLEGRPLDVVQGDHPAYHDFAAKLAEEGYITFAPQNLYIFGDRFRTLQRKANSIGKTLFSIMVPQHQQIVNWLKSLPNVDPKRIAFYGLSYGGKSAMRIPPLVPDYCLSICSADFNEWVWKNASTSSPYSYVWTGEYEIFEFDLGSTFNYSEMAALIAPRPFMVERGHFDGVSSDQQVAYEFAKVRHLYQARLKIGDRCAIEFFDGPHTIHGKGTFDFLRRHLRPPSRR